MKEIALNKESTDRKTSEGALATAIKKLPFSFAKKHKILIRSFRDESVEAYYYGKIPSHAIAEIRRFAGLPITLRKITDSQFDDLLRKTYEENSQSTMQMAGDIDDNYDLLTAAQELPE